MMKATFRRRAAAAFLAVFTGGCSTYPLPEDVTGFNSDQIASIVRCQTRDAIREEIYENILAARANHVYRGMTGVQLVELLRAKPEEFRKLDWTRFSDELRGPFVFYKDTSISYDFTIDSTEVNANGVDVTLLDQLTRGSRRIGLTAKNERTREVKRHFRVFDSFDSLVRLMPEGTCAGLPRQENTVYPATGLMRIRSLVRSFLRQNQLGNLGGDKEDYNTAQMTDTITFNTKFTGNVDPSSQLNPVTNTFVPTNIAVNLDNSRQDMHTIIILLRLPPNTSGLPRFDEIGRLTLPKAEKQRAIAADALDRQRDFNTQDALIQLGTGIGRTVP